jgi:hypothetical protein
VGDATAGAVTTVFGEVDGFAAGASGIGLGGGASDVVPVVCAATGLMLQQHIDTRTEPVNPGYRPMVILLEHRRGKGSLAFPESYELAPKATSDSTLHGCLFESGART